MKRYIRFTRSIVLLISLFMVLFFTGCATVPKVGPVDEPAFRVFTLDNGIPVVLKITDVNRIFTLQTIIRGHTAFLPEGKAGLEGVTLSMLTRGSEKYDYETLQRIMYEKSSAISTGFQNFDYTSYSLNTLDKYFEELFDVYADTFLHPAWDKEEYYRVISDFSIVRKQREQDPYGRASIILNEKFFEGHPYNNDTQGTLKSLQSISLDDIKAYYQDTFKAERMFILAVGNFDENLLVDRLNDTFGTIPKGRLKIDTAPPHSPQEGLILEPFAESEGLAFVRGNYPLPSPGNKDLTAIQLAFAMLDDLLFEVVRTRHGACYSVWANPFSFSANYGNIGVYRTSVPGEVKAYVDEAIAILHGGQTLAAQVSAAAQGHGTESEGSLVPIAESLQFYKDQFVTGYYQAQQTNIAVAAQIAAGYVYTGDFLRYQGFVDRIQGVTAEDIVHVVRKYLVDTSISWIVLGNQELLDQVDPDDYTRLPGSE
ncbi:MAG: insulinase family protein [Spirochaetales bacterium]|nr:insulinase family protein [Spirochaetales bacterium]